MYTVRCPHCNHRVFDGDYADTEVIRDPIVIDPEYFEASIVNSEYQITNEMLTSENILKEVKESLSEWERYVSK